MDLLLIPIRKHKYARVPAFKVSTLLFIHLQALDYLLANGDSHDCENFIDKKGLKYVFPALLGKVGLRWKGVTFQNNGNALKKWDNVDVQEFENHVLSILVSLLNLDSVLIIEIVYE